MFVRYRHYLLMSHCSLIWIGPTKDDEGNDCPLTCNVNCLTTETFCQSGLDARGCKLPDSCVARQNTRDGDLCQGVCDISCDDNEIKCPVPPNAEGCPQTSVCLPKPKDSDGNDCPAVCPTFCNEDENLCPGQTTEKGCHQWNLNNSFVLRARPQDPSPHLPGVEHWKEFCFLQQNDF